MLPTAADLGMGVVHLPGGQEVWVRKASYASQASSSRSMLPDVAAMGANAQTLGPGEVWPAAHPEDVEPRRFNYQPGFNIRTDAPLDRAVSFAMLKALTTNYDVARLVIEHRKNEMRGLEYVVQPKAVRGQKRDEAKARSQELEGSIDAAMDFFAKPNREDFWSVWLGQWLEDLFAIDAPTIYRRRGATAGCTAPTSSTGDSIRPIIDYYGRVPLPPEPAYGQVLFGQTWGTYTTDELLYTPYWQRPDSPYGHPPAEWIILSINRAIRRQAIDLTNYTEGTLPVGVLPRPRGLVGRQIGELQDDLRRDPRGQRRGALAGPVRPGRRRHRARPGPPRAEDRGRGVAPLPDLRGVRRVPDRHRLPAARRRARREGLLRPAAGREDRGLDEAARGPRQGRLRRDPRRVARDARARDRLPGAREERGHRKARRGRPDLRLDRQDERRRAARARRPGPDRARGVRRAPERHPRRGPARPAGSGRPDRSRDRAAAPDAVRADRRGRRGRAAEARRGRAAVQRRRSAAHRRADREDRRRARRLVAQGEACAQGRPAGRGAVRERGPRARPAPEDRDRPRRGDHRRGRPARLRAREGRCIRRPFRAELERELRQVWAATSVPWASASPTGSASGRRPYP
jgi:hypothetical protein